MGSHLPVWSALPIAVVLLVAAAPTAVPAASAPTSSSAAVAAATTDHEYLGAKKCRPCHLPEYNSWRKSLMARSFDLLKPGVRPEAKTAAGLDPDSDYTTDAGCLSCHTTGYGEPSGFRDLKSTPNLTGITCESCHGPGSSYSVDSLMSLKNKNHSFESVIAAGLVYPVPAAVCQRCHNDDGPHKVSVEPKYAFDYMTQISKGAHQHIELKYEHGPLPDGVLFQKQQ